jgi:hypothetical protein
MMMIMMIMIMMIIYMMMMMMMLFPIVNNENPMGPQDGGYNSSIPVLMIGSGLVDDMMNAFNGHHHHRDRRKSCPSISDDACRPDDADDDDDYHSDRIVDAPYPSYLKALLRVSFG